MTPAAAAMGEDLFGEPTGFSIQQHGHKDMVEASAFNSYGTRFALGSADGKIKVFDRLRNGSWGLCDTWAAHNAEVLEVSFGEMLDGSGWVGWVADTDTDGLGVVALVAADYTSEYARLNIDGWEVQVVG